MTNLPPKDPDDVLDYGLDWGELLEEDEIVSSEWEADAGIQAANDTRQGHVTIVWLSGGSAGRRYAVTNQVRTAAGRVYHRSFHVRVEER